MAPAPGGATPWLRQPPREPALLLPRRRDRPAIPPPDRSAAPHAPAASSCATAGTRPQIGSWPPARRVEPRPGCAGAADATTSRLECPIFGFDLRASTTDGADQRFEPAPGLAGGPPTGWCSRHPRSGAAPSCQPDPPPARRPLGAPAGHCHAAAVGRLHPDAAGRHHPRAAGRRPSKQPPTIPPHLAASSSPGLPGRARDGRRRSAPGHLPSHQPPQGLGRGLWPAPRSRQVRRPKYATGRPRDPPPPVDPSGTSWR